ncbi:MAG: hypothetical protein RIR70_2159 [Pseudomonadota bacterium]|jgi:dienelactone hydrolase
MRRHSIGGEARFWGALMRALVLCIALTPPARAEDTLAADLKETIHRIEVSVTDPFGRTETKPLVLTVMKPATGGPWPLVVINHGRAIAAKRAAQGRARHEDQARYFTSRGFAVILPTRVGYAETYGDFDPEYTGCGSSRVNHLHTVLRSQIVAAVEFARSQPDIDASRWLVTGSSVGGLASLMTLQDPPPGLIGGINFAGGIGGNPDIQPGAPCDPQRLSDLFRTARSERRVPNLWIYWANDRYWGAQIPKDWFAAWRATQQPAEYIELPAIPGDGHLGFSRDMDAWTPKVDAFLKQLGFAQQPPDGRPAPSGFARIDEVDKVPVPEKTREGLYRRFLAASPPRAFAISPSGRAGFAFGDWAAGRAIGFCQRLRGERCALYAVDHDVVWQGTAPR